MRFYQALPNSTSVLSPSIIEKTLSTVYLQVSHNMVSTQTLKSRPICFTGRSVMHSNLHVSPVSKLILASVLEASRIHEDTIRGGVVHAPSLLDGHRCPSEPLCPPSTLPSDCCKGSWRKLVWREDAQQRRMNDTCLFLGRPCTAAPSFIRCSIVYLNLVAKICLQ